MFLRFEALVYSLNIAAKKLLKSVVVEYSLFVGIETNTFLSQNPLCSEIEITLNV